MYWVPIGGQGARSFWPSGKRCPGFLHPWGSGAGWSVASPGLPVARCWLHTLPVGGGSLPCPGLSCPPPAPLIPGSPGFPCCQSRPCGRVGESGISAPSIWMRIRDCRRDLPLIHGAENWGNWGQ